MTTAFESLPKEFVGKALFYDYRAPITEVLGKLKMDEAIVLLKGKEYYGIIDERSVAKRSRIKIEKKAAAAKFATKAPLLDMKTSMSKAIRDFYESGSKALPYYEGGKVTGIVKRVAMLKALLSLRMLSGVKVKDVMTSPLLSINSDASIEEALTMMKQRDVNRLGVLNNGRFSGMISYRSILQYSATLRERGSAKMENSSKPQGRVAAIADIDVNSADYNDDADDVIRSLVERNASGLVVERGGKPVGVITIKDIFRAAAGEGTESSGGIIVSGMDGELKGYEDDIRDGLQKFIDKLDRFSGVKVESLSFHAKKQKIRNYELTMRVWFQNGGAISASARGFSIEKAFKDLAGEAYKEIKKKKEILSVDKRQRARSDEEDE